MQTSHKIQPFQTDFSLACHAQGNDKQHDRRSLIQYLLDDQQQLSAVDTFARQIDGCGAMLHVSRYQNLLPATPPMAGQQYSFEVDLDSCSGCKACVTACHVLNGLDEDEAWRDVGTLIGGDASSPTIQHVTAACHHCLSPACMTACPVNAFEKDPVTGIVRHLDDQCFGCQYCTMACPYEVPKYHRKKGIIRKCDMCEQRLSAGEPPACVQSCPHEAISIRIVEHDRVYADAETAYFLPAAPEPHITFPTTNYKTKRVFPKNMLPADYYSVSSQHPHWPLIVMLVLTQLSVGAYCMGLFHEPILGESFANAVRPVHAVHALVFGLIALLASVFHLGRPQYAFRAVLGLRHSWLSREIIAFGLFALLACAYAAATWVFSHNSTWINTLGCSVGIVGVGGVFCSAMIYVFPKREFWSFSATITKFFSTGIILGLCSTLTISAFIRAGYKDSIDADAFRYALQTLSMGIALMVFAKIMYELSIFTHLASFRLSALKRSAKLMSGPLLNIVFARFALAGLGGLMLPYFIFMELAKPSSEIFVAVIAIAAFVCVLLGELLERYLFFAAVATPRMPGIMRG